MWFHDIKQLSEEQNYRVGAGSNTIKFLNGHLVKKMWVNRAEDTVNYYDFEEHRMKIMSWSQFKKLQRPAYTLTDVGRLLNRTNQTKLWHRAQEFDVPSSLSYNVQKQTRNRTRTYYPEEAVFILRDALAQIHRGSPRKDGQIVPAKSIPSRDELISLMRTGSHTYVKNSKGEFIPVWKEFDW